MQILGYLTQNSLTAYPFKDRMSSDTAGNANPIQDDWFYDIQFTSFLPTLHRVFVSHITKTELSELYVVFSDVDTSTYIGELYVPPGEIVSHYQNNFKSFAFASTEQFAVKVVLGPGLVGATAFVQDYVAADTELVTAAVIPNNPRVNTLTIKAHDTTLALALGQPDLPFLIHSFNPSTSVPVVRPRYNSEFILEAPQVGGLSAARGLGAGKYDNCERLGGSYIATSTSPIVFALTQQTISVVETALDYAAVQHIIAATSSGYVEATVVAYDPGSGTLIFNVDAYNGTGTSSGPWTINRAGITIRSINATKPNDSGALFLKPSSCYTANTLTGSDALIYAQYLAPYRTAAVHTGPETTTTKDIVAANSSIVLQNHCKPKCEQATISAFAHYLNRVTDGAAELNARVFNSVETRGTGTADLKVFTATQFCVDNSPFQGCDSVACNPRFIKNFHEGLKLRIYYANPSINQYFTIISVADDGNSVVLDLPPTATGNALPFMVFDDGIISNVNCATAKYNIDAATLRQPNFKIKYTTTEQYAGGTYATFILVTAALFNPSSSPATLQTILHSTNLNASQNIKIRKISGITNSTSSTVTLQCREYALVEFVLWLPCGGADGTLSIEVWDNTTESPHQIGETYHLPTINAPICPGSSVNDAELFNVTQANGTTATKTITLSANTTSISAFTGNAPSWLRSVFNLNAHNCVLSVASAPTEKSSNLFSTKFTSYGAGDIIHPVDIAYIANPVLTSLAQYSQTAPLKIDKLITYTLEQPILTLTTTNMFPLSSAFGSPADYVYTLLPVVDGAPVDGGALPAGLLFDSVGGVLYGTVDIDIPQGTKFTLAAAARNPSARSDYQIFVLKIGTGILTIPTITTSPTASDITYGQTLADSTLSGGVASVPGTFAFVSIGVAPDVGTTEQYVRFTPEDIVSYAVVTLPVSVLVGKATPTVSFAPTAAGIAPGQTLAASTLSAGTVSVAGTFAFVNLATVPPTGSSSQPVIFTPTDITRYETVTLSVDILVDALIPVISERPTAAVITYGQPLGDSALSGGTASVAGTFAFVSPTTTPDVGSAPQLVVFTPVSELYSVAIISVYVSVDKLTPTITTSPTASPITYGQTLADSTLSGGVASTSGTFAFVFTNVKPTFGTSNQLVEFTPQDTNNYNVTTFNVSVQVGKATPSFATYPVATNIKIYQKLSAATLLGGNPSTPGTFSYVTPNMTLMAAGTTYHDVLFTPLDLVRYNTTTISVPVQVDKLTPTITTSPTASDITYGQTLADSTLSGGVASTSGTFAFVTPSLMPVVGSFTQLVVFTPVSDDLYSSVTISIPVYTAQQRIRITEYPTTSTIVQGQPLSDVVLTGGAAQGYTDNSTLSGEFALIYRTSIPAPGTSNHFVRFTPTDSNYAVITIPVAVTVTAVLIDIVPPTAEAITLGQILALSTLTGGEATLHVEGTPVDGSFVFASPALKPLATALQVVRFEPSSSKYSTSTMSVSVTVIPLTITTPPTASTIVYGKPLSTSVLRGGVASIPGTFAFSTPSAQPESTGLQEVTFTPTDTLVAPVTLNVTVVVNKATPAFSNLPALSNIFISQPLSTSTISGGQVYYVPLAQVIAGTLEFDKPNYVPPVLGVNLVGVKFTPDDTTHYNSFVANLFITTIGVSSPTITTLPTASPILTGTTLSTSTLTGGAASYGGASVDGSFAFKYPTTVVAYRESPQAFSVTFTPTNTAKYAPITFNVTVPILSDKLSPIITVAPTISTITHQQSLGAVTFSGGTVVAAVDVYNPTQPASPTVNVPGVFGFLNPGAIPPIGTASYPFRFTPLDTQTYTSIIAGSNLVVTVEKAVPKIKTSPTTSSAYVGQTLADVTLTGGQATISTTLGTFTVAGTFSFQTPTTQLTIAGITTQSVTFTPDNLTEYAVVTSTVKVTTLAKVTPVLSVLPATTLLTPEQPVGTVTIYGGAATANGVPVAGSFAFSDPTATYTPTGYDGECSPPIATTQITFHPVDTAKYNDFSFNHLVYQDSGDVCLTVTLPTVSSISVGASLDTATLTGGLVSFTKFVESHCPPPSFYYRIDPRPEFDSFTFAEPARTFTEPGNYTVAVIASRSNPILPYYEDCDAGTLGPFTVNITDRVAFMTQITVTV